MFEDPWKSDYAQSEALEREGDRQVLAELLIARNQPTAAAIVALCELRLDQVDNWDGGQYELVLAVPAPAYDMARGELFEALRSAGEAVVGDGHYRGIVITLRRTPQPDWGQQLLAWLRSQNARAVVPPALEAGPTVTAK